MNIPSPATIVGPACPSYIFLTCYSIHLIELVIWVSFYTPNQAKSWKEPDYMFALYILFLCLQPLNLLCAFMTEFPTTSNLPELSIEPIPPEKTWCEAISEHIGPVTQCFQRTREVITSLEMWDFFSAQQMTQACDNSMLNLIHAEANKTNVAPMEI